MQADRKRTLVQDLDRVPAKQGQSQLSTARETNALVSLSDLADDILRRHLDVVKVEGAGR